jgi:hypothetical protein
LQAQKTKENSMELVDIILSHVDQLTLPASPPVVVVKKDYCCQLACSAEGVESILGLNPSSCHALLNAAV